MKNPRTHPVKTRRQARYGYSKLPYLLALVFGLTFPFIPDLISYPIVFGFAYLLAGSLLGVFWPGVSWRWGFWLAAPFFIIVAIDVLISGPVGESQIRELVESFVPIVIAGTGSFIFSRYIRQRSRRLAK